MVAGIESGLNGLNDDTIAHVRQRMIGLHMNSKPPPSNILPSERKALRDLRAEPDIMTLPADKGRATALLDRQKKMRTMLSDISTYRVIQKDPTSSLQRKMNGLLLQLKKLVPFHHRYTIGSDVHLDLFHLYMVYQQGRF